MLLSLSLLQTSLLDIGTDLIPLLFIIVICIATVWLPIAVQELR